MVVEDFWNSKRAVSANVRSLVRQLLTHWNADWGNADYLGVVLPDLMEHLDKATPEEREILHKIRQLVSDSEWSRLPTIAKEEYQKLHLVDSVKQEITKRISFFQLNHAHKLFLQHADLIDSGWYTEKRTRQIARRRASIEDLLFSWRFEEAKEVYEDSLTLLLHEEQHKLAEWYSTSLQKALNGYIDGFVIPLLEKYKFREARKVFAKIQEYAKTIEYEEIERKYREEARTSLEDNGPTSVTPNKKHEYATPRGYKIVPASQFHQAILAHELSLKRPAHDQRKLTRSLSAAAVDLNPHQIDAALFAFQSPLSRGALLADEVGLGKTIEAGLVIAQLYAEGKHKILIIVPASLRKQWQNELLDKFDLPSEIIAGHPTVRLDKGIYTNVFDQEGILICSMHYAYHHADDICRNVPYDLVIIDEAHHLRNVWKKSNKMAKVIQEAICDQPKLLLTFFISSATISP